MNKTHIFFLGLMSWLVFFAGLVTFTTWHASALGGSYFDSGNDTRPHAPETENPTIRLTVGQTAYVQHASARLGLYFTSPSGSVNIYGYNFCPTASGDPDFSNKTNPSVGTKITKFSSTGHDPIYGTMQKSGSACDPGNAKTITFSNLSRDDTGYYKATLDVTHRDFRDGEWDGVLNYFRVTARNADGSSAIVAQRGADAGNTKGYEVTIEQSDGQPDNTDYFIRFGSDCTVQSNTKRYISFYDLDNALSGTGGAQQHGYITMSLYETPPGKPINTKNAADLGTRITISDGDTSGTDITPKGRANDSTRISFTAKPGMRYVLIVRNVYKNNTIQYGTPFDGIYYMSPCSPPKVTAKANLDCTTLTGIAYDPNLPSQPLQVFIYAGGPKGTVTPVEVTANLPTSDSDAPKNPDGSTMNVGFSWTIDPPGAADYTGVSYWVYAKDIGPTGIQTGNYTPYEKNPVKIGPCKTADVICTAASTGLASKAAIAQPLNFTVSATFSGAIPTGATITGVTLTTPSGTAVPFTPTITPSGSDLRSSGMTYTPTAGGEHVLRWYVDVPSSGTHKECTAKTNVGYQPFFTVRGGDVMAGVSTCEAGNADSSAIVSGWNKGSAGNYDGANSNLAIIAAANISGVATSHAVPWATSPQRLAFANTSVDLTVNLFGGNFDMGAMGCTEDYAKQAAKDPAATTAGAGTINLNGLSGTVIVTGNVTLSSTVLGASKRVTLVVENGNVYVTGNILYSYGSIDQIPRANVFVRNGNIVLSPGVSELHGIYIAHGDGDTNGVFNTCGTNGADTNTVTAAEYAICNTNLKVYGSVVARTLKLNRTLGNLYASGAVQSVPAEEFIYSPEAWLGGETTSSGAPKYDWYIGLPPVL